jgi:hypothetical protein
LNFENGAAAFSRALVASWINVSTSEAGMNPPEMQRSSGAESGESRSGFPLSLATRAQLEREF